MELPKYSERLTKPKAIQRTMINAEPFSPLFSRGRRKKTQPSTLKLQGSFKPQASLASGLSIDASLMLECSYLMLFISVRGARRRHVRMRLAQKRHYHLDRFLLHKLACVFRC